MKHPRRSIPLLCLAILLGAVALGARCPHIDICFFLPPFPGGRRRSYPASTPWKCPGRCHSIRPAAHRLGGPGHFPVGSPVQCSGRRGELLPGRVRASRGHPGQNRRNPQPAHPRFAVRNHTGHPGPAARTTEDRIATCRVLLSLPPMDPAELDQDAAIQTQEEANQKIQAQLDRLLSFQERLQQEATEENAYDLWCVLWDDILQEPQPTLAAPEA